MTPSHELNCGLVPPVPGFARGPSTAAFTRSRGTQIAPSPGSAAGQVRVPPLESSSAQIQRSNRTDCMLDSVEGFNIAVPHVQQSAKHLPQFHCSFAQLLDPEEGNELKFVPSPNINGIRCGKIEKSDVLDEITYWQNAVLCSVMGANPPFEVMKGFFNRIWGKFAIDRIIYVRKGVFLVHFSHQQDKIQVEKRGFYFFDSKPMLVKG